MNEIFANCIWIFHLGIVLFVLFGPFSDIPGLLLIHFTFCACLLIHWWSNSNVCSLSLMESHLRGTDVSSTFSHRLISPIYDVNSKAWTDICYILTIGLMFTSFYKLWNSPRIFKAKECWKNSKIQECLALLVG